MQGKDEQYYDNNNGNNNANTDEDQDNPPGIFLEPAASRGEIAGVPPTENPLELPEVDPTENTL